jgi:glycosyltransferase involved in cell wall biosynthesis
MNCDWLVQLDRRLIHERLRGADAIIGCCEYITDNIRRRFPEYADRCITVYNGADIGEFLPREERTESSAGARVLYVGRVSPEKGLHVLLDAFERVVAVRPEARLEVVGGEYLPPMGFIVGVSANPEIRALGRFYGSSYLQYLRDRVRAELLGRVSFAGSLAHHEVAERLRKADIFVQPSVWSEPFPLSVVEAMATGLPVVGSRAGGLPEAVADNETGLLVESGDPGALAEALLKLINDQALAWNMGESGCTRARRMFSWDAVAGTLSRCYEALCSGVTMTAADRTGMLLRSGSVGATRDCHPQSVE